jgi:hypothetical protein
MNCLSTRLNHFLLDGVRSDRDVQLNLDLCLITGHPSPRNDWSPNKFEHLLHKLSTILIHVQKKKNYFLHCWITKISILNRNAKHCLCDITDDVWLKWNMWVKMPSPNSYSCWSTQMVRLNFFDHARSSGGGWKYKYGDIRCNWLIDVQV